MTNGKVIIIRGQVAGNLVIEEHDLDGEAEALIMHLDQSAPAAGFRKIQPLRDNRMNIRSKPTIADNIVGSLHGSTEVIEEIKLDEFNIWVRIGFNQYVALIYRGAVYCEYVG
jgi:hypothetical protein